MTKMKLIQIKFYRAQTSVSGGNAINVEKNGKLQLVTEQAKIQFALPVLENRYGKKEEITQNKTST